LAAVVGRHRPWGAGAFTLARGAALVGSCSATRLAVCPPSVDAARRARPPGPDFYTAGTRGDAGRSPAAHRQFMSLPIACLADRRCVFVDLETTGTAAARERITEIGIVTVDFDGTGVRVGEWTTLVNPERPIPSEIQWLTGITNEMVRAAPRFADIADEVLERLRDAVFIAHNARFDYGFLKAEFARLGIPWRATTLCTVRLSRLLDPDRSPHGLDAIVARYGLDGEQRHRALGDARVLWRFLQRLAATRPPFELDAAIRTLLAKSSTPPMLAPDALDGIPEAPGVYLFYGLNAHPIYIGKSLTLRTRILSHFSADHSNAQDAKLAQEVCRVEWEETAGETGALLREAELVKTRLPAHNIALRRRQGAVLLRLDANKPKFVPAAQVSLDALNDHHGPFASRAGGRSHLIELAREHALCLKTLELERGAKKARNAESAPAPCFAYQLKRCLGACVGQEDAAAHAQRLAALVEPLRIPPWPFDGPVALVERRGDGSREDLHVADRWCWLGSVRTLDAALALARSDAPRRFEADVYRIVRSALDRASAEVVALGAVGVAAVTP
jgi:DNA polymerase-3 subunit epsilon